MNLFTLFKKKISWKFYDLDFILITIFQIWFLNAESLDTARPEWQAGQVTLDTVRDFRIYLEVKVFFASFFLMNMFFFVQGKASNGGFAIDQLTFYPGDCPSK